MRPGGSGPRLDNSRARRQSCGETGPAQIERELASRPPRSEHPANRGSAPLYANCGQPRPASRPKVPAHSIEIRACCVSVRGNRRRATAELTRRTSQIPVSPCGTSHVPMRGMSRRGRSLHRLGGSRRAGTKACVQSTVSAQSPRVANLTTLEPIAAPARIWSRNGRRRGRATPRPHGTRNAPQKTLDRATMQPPRHR